MGDTQPIMDGSRAAVRAHITVTIDRRANDKDRARVAGCLDSGVCYRRLKPWAPSMGP